MATRTGSSSGSTGSTPAAAAIAGAAAWAWPSSRARARRSAAGSGSSTRRPGRDSWSNWTPRRARRARRARVAADHEARPGDAGDQYAPDPVDRRRAEGQLRTPRIAARRCADGLRAVAAPPQARPERADLVRSRPLRAVGGPRLGAAVLAAPPHRLRARARRAQA